MRWVFIGIVALNLLYLGWKAVAAEDLPVAASEGVAALQAAKEYPATLKLIAERTEAVPVPSGLPVDSRFAGGCPALGPFANDADAGRVAKALGGHGFEAAVLGVDKSASPVFWVYLPPLQNRQAAMRKLRELQAKGIDSFVVTDGADANAISLGSFASRDSALGVQVRMRVSGYDVSIREQLKGVRQALVVLDNAQAQGFMEFVPADLKAAAHLDRQACVNSR